MIDDALIVSMLAATIRISAPLLFAALGELVTERAGVWNLGVEGTVLMGGFVAFFVSYWADSLWFGVVAAMLAGMLMGVIMAFMSATLKVNQFLSGLALNLLAAGLTLFWYRIELRSSKVTFLRSIGLSTSRCRFSPRFLSWDASSLPRPC